MNGSVMQFAAIIILLGVDSVIDIKSREIPNWIIAHNRVCGRSADANSFE